MAWRRSSGLRGQQQPVSYLVVMGLVHGGLGYICMDSPVTHSYPRKGNR